MGREELRRIFVDFLSKHKDSRIAIATHSRADADSISCAFLLSKLLPNSVITVSEEMREGARMLAERFGMDLKELSHLERKDFDGLVAVDTSTYTLLSDARGWKVLCIIDHHQAEGRDMQAQFTIVDSQAPSTAEILHNIIDDIDKDSAFALCVAIIADGARFKSARMESFAALSDLMRVSGADYRELLRYAEPEPKEEAKIAMLKAMSQVKYVYAAGYIIATTEASSNESDAASIIAEAADVAFVASWRDREQETRISARARSSVEVPLNKVLAEVGEATGGAGGGHPKAAGASSKEHTQETLQLCVDTFIRMAQ